MSSANALCASRFFCREGTRSRSGMFERRKRGRTSKTSTAREARFPREDTLHERLSRTRNSRLARFAQILGRVLEIAVRDQLPLLPGGRRGGQRRGPAEGSLADGARRGNGARLAELRGETRGDEVRRLATELFSSRPPISKLGHPSRSSRDPPNERAAARYARARGGRSPWSAGSAGGAVPATPRWGKTPARAEACARARQSTMSFVLVRVVDRTSGVDGRCVDEIRFIALRLLRTCS